MMSVRPRLMVDMFTVAVVISVAVALAGLTWRLQGYSGVPPVAAPLQQVSTGTADAASIVALAPFGQAAGDAVALASGEVTLRAIFAAEPSSASVTLIAGPDNMVVPYTIGEVTPAGIVEAIEPERVLLRSGSGLQVLSFNPAAAGVAGVAGVANAATPESGKPPAAVVADLNDPSVELPPPPPSLPAPAPSR